jgi:putative transposase
MEDGRPEKPRHPSALPHLRDEGGTYFVTFVTHNRRHLSEAERDLVLAACLHWDGRRARIYAAVVMPDHVHLLLQPLEGHSLSSLLHSIRSYSAHQVAAERSRHEPVWMPESQDRTIRGDHDLLATAQYIEANPVRAGLADDQSQYRWLYYGSAAE